MPTARDPLHRPCTSAGSMHSAHSASGNHGVPVGVGVGMWAVRDLTHHALPQLRQGYNGPVGDSQPSADRDLRDDLTGPGRFEILRRLGSGGMGVVYEAHDRERDLRVALKTLKRVNAASIYRFKREFRSLADVSHPNLVTLYELIGIADRWFFTMELIDGVDLLSYVRRHPTVDSEVREDSTASLAARRLASSPGGDETSPTNVGTSSSPSRQRIVPPADSAIVWRILPQLGEALNALHRTGHLHRDIKPSNILVTPDDRLVLLDFGVITELAGHRHNVLGEGFVGTPAYAAPEQAADPWVPSPASDWYSVGAILYEALAGRRPHSGSAEAMLEAKCSRDPVPLHVHNPDVDESLAELCMSLLSRDPSARPTGEQIVARLRARQPSPEPGRRRERTSTAAELALVGRDRQLGELDRAFELVRGGSGAAVHVQGRSGMGKTALVQHFLADIADRGDALVLSGRCYERESVPYQALDSLVDALCRYLLDLPRARADALMPLDVRHLARAFPVLRRVEAIARAQRRSVNEETEPLEARRRVFGALRELLARLAEQRPLVLFIDDLQWGDVDSAQFLARLMRPPVPPLLFVVTYRSEELSSSAALEIVRAAAETDEARTRFIDITIGRLPLADARELATELLREAGAPVDAAEHIARESHGNPFFVHEFARYVSSHGTGGRAEDLDLAEVIMARIGALSDDARRLMKTIAVAGRPLMQGLASRAAGIGDGLPRALAELRSAHLVRTTGARAYDTVECYHDRIRETVLGRLADDELRTIHLDVARGLASSAQPDIELMALHYAAAGERLVAFDYAVSAAETAAKALAFERAAALFRLAVELEPDDNPDRGLLRSQLGDALVNSGRGVEAAEAFLAAVPDVDPQTGLDLQVRAGSELLRSGRLAEGLDVLAPALAGAGANLASSPRRALWSLLLGRLRTRLRGLHFRPRSPAEIPQAQLTRIDAFAGASGPLGMADNLRGADVQTRHLLAALRAGEPTRVGRALVYESALSTLGGPRTRRRTNRLLGMVDEIASDTGDPRLSGQHKAMSALAAYQCGEWTDCRDLATAAEQILRERCRGTTWELSSAQMYWMWALYWLGDFAELGTVVNQFVREARERGDLYAEVSMSTGLPSFAGLANDQPEATRTRVQAAFDRWVAEGFHLQHYWAHLGLAQCELYAGDPLAALRRMDEIIPAMRRAFLYRIALVRAEITQLCGRAALAASMLDGDAARWRRRAEQEIRHLKKFRLAWCTPAAELLRAGLAVTAGEPDAAVAVLPEIARRFDTLDMGAFAAVARRSHGLLLGGDDGAGMVAAADDELHQRGVANPARMTAYLAPGFEASEP